MKAISIITLATLLLGLINSTSYAGWLIFHKPAYKGKVIDIDTKEPIEGAVVVAIYHKYPIISGPAGGSSTVINVREALTDKEGKFEIPSYTTLIAPLFESEYTTFIVFKLGYASVSNLNLEDSLSKETGKEIELPWLYNQEIKFRFAPGVVQLPRIKEREERRINISTISPSPDDFLECRKNLIRLINEEEKNLGLQQSDPFKARDFIRKGK